MTGTSYVQAVLLCVLWVFTHATAQPCRTRLRVSVCRAERCNNAFSVFLCVVFNKLLIIFPLIIHLTEEQVE